MQKQKNIKLLISLGIVIILIALMPLLKKDNNGLSVNKKQFTLNPQTVITDVLLTSNSMSNKFSYIQGGWQVNNSYELDPNMRDVFFSVLSQMSIRREVPQSQNDSISNLIHQHGVSVDILNNADTIKSYKVWGNSDFQTSYLMDKERQSYIIHIPGYRSYVAGIFEVPESDWRTRRVFSAQFTNLNSLKIEYSKEQIEYRYKDSFFEIIDISADSTQLITSLENLLFLQTDQFLLSSDHDKYYVDSLSNTSPIATISTVKLSGASESAIIYNTNEQQSFYLGLVSDSSYCLFNKTRLKKILRKKSDFE